MGQDGLARYWRASRPSLRLSALPFWMLTLSLDHLSRSRPERTLA